MGVGVSHATAQWSGSLFEGRGSVTPASGSFGELQMTWEGRTDRPEGSTSPEELIASAHAEPLFDGAFQHSGQGRQRGGEPPGEGRGHLRDGRRGSRISTVHLDVTGKVPGIDQEGFADAVAKAKDGCPVSKALAGNVDISADATLG